MAGHAPQYFAGMLDVGSDPDWERVAKVVDLLRACGVCLETVPARVRQNGSTELPFFAKLSEQCELLSGTADPKRAIEELSPYRLNAYRRVDPKTSGSYVLSALVKLSCDNCRDEPAKPADLRPRPAPAASCDDAFAGLVGLERQRELLRKIATLVGKHGRGAVDCLHMAFLGGPGTGKTELARRLLAHFDAIGVTDGNGTFVKATAGDLVGRYVGHTAPKTRAAVERALGGMLFIDEAYALTNAGDYGQEAIDTLVEALEANRDRLVCVIAGYGDEVEELFRRNPGLRDRFGFRVAFDGYTTDELVQIFGRFAQGRGFSVDPSAASALHACLEGLRGKRGFANARTARRLCDRAILECASRTDEACVRAEDIRAAYDQPDLGGDASGGRVGFVG